MENRCNPLVHGLDVGDACFASDSTCLALLVRTLAVFWSAEAFSCGLPVAADGAVFGRFGYRDNLGRATLGNRPPAR